MRTFTDAAGRVWTLAIHVAAIKRVHARLGLNLYQLLDDRFQGLGALLGDPVRLVDVLFVLCQDEAQARNVTDEDFGRAMFGDAIHHAAEAFLEELIDFFPRSTGAAIAAHDPHRSPQRPPPGARPSGTNAGQLRCRPRSEQAHDLVWHCAGVLGLDHGPFTLAELVRMAEACCRERWNHTAALMALLANCHRDPKRKPMPYKPADFHPYPKEPTPSPAKASIQVLKAIFVDRDHA